MAANSQAEVRAGGPDERGSHVAGTRGALAS
jgi:hypothetical protein